jgi:CAAX prenyl protease-like protein
MKEMIRRLRESPLAVRVLPFAVFGALTIFQGEYFEANWHADLKYWIYAGKSVVGAWILWVLRDVIREMKWAWSWEALVAGVAVFALWVGLDGMYPSLGDLFGGGGDEVVDEAAAPPWNPLAAFSGSMTLGWFFVVVRIVGSSIVVPPLEEIFYRSFLYRYIAKPDFEKMPLGTFHWQSFVVTSVFFGVAHFEWLSGILCGLIYQWLVVRKGRLGDAMTAHAITNFLLGVYVVWKGEWQFW